MDGDIDSAGHVPYVGIDEIDFSIITMGMKRLPFFEDYLYLGMQAMNVGVTDSIITTHEYALLREYFQTDRTPGPTAMAVSALSQMWIYGLYEVLRMWRGRKHQFEKLRQNGGAQLKLKNMPDDDPLNITIETRRRQLRRYNEDSRYREAIQTAWSCIEDVYRMTELFRINLAKHCAPGKDGVVPRAPGYGRINSQCGALDYELIEKDGYYTLMNRRDMADALRTHLSRRAQGESPDRRP